MGRLDREAERARASKVFVEPNYDEARRHVLGLRSFLERMALSAPNAPVSSGAILFKDTLDSIAKFISDHESLAKWHEKARLKATVHIRDGEEADQ